MYTAVIIDDEAIIRSSLRTKLEHLFADIRIIGTADNGMEALTVCLEMRPDIIVTDIRMPHMDGIELLAKLKQTDCQAEVIIVSGFDDFTYARSAIRFGVSDYLLKPIKNEQLAETVTNVIAALDKRANERDERLKQKEAFKKIGREAVARAALAGEGFPDITLDPALEQELAQLNAGSVRVAVIGPVPQSASSSYDLVLASAKHFWEPYEIPLVLFEDHWALLFNRNRIFPELDDACLEPVIRMFLSESGMVYNKASLSAGVGNVYTGFASVARSYREALNASRFRIIDDQDKVNFYGFNSKSDKGYHEAARLSERITDVFFSDNLQELENAVSDYFMTCRADGFVKLIDLQAECMKMITTISIKAEKKQLRSERKNVQTLVDPLFIAGSLAELQQTFLSLLASLSRDIHAHAQQHDGKTSFIAKAQAYISGNFGSKLTLEQIAKAVYVHPSYLSTSFKKETGQSLVDYINVVRIERAKELLNWSESLVKDIALQVGYEDYGYFCKVFKKSEGMSPLEFRALSLHRRDSVTTAYQMKGGGGDDWA